MQLNPSEISDLIKKRIEGFEATSEARSEGTIVSLSDGICRIHGLADVMQGEMIDFGNNLYGLALNLERDSVGAVVLGDYKAVSEGDKVKCTSRILEVPTGEALLGRVVDSLGAAIDGKGPTRRVLSNVSQLISRSRPVLNRLTPWFRSDVASVS
jgi:F-type H+-transporting ATPase subunit alpha